MDERLQIMVGQERVEGRFVFLFFNDMQVEITSPFQGVSDGLHIPCFCLPFGRYEQNGTLTQKGQETAHWLLRKIYDACLFCEANADELLQECRGLLDLGAWGLLSRSPSRKILSAAWHLSPVALLVSLLTKWEMVNFCRNTLAKRFGPWLPEDLVRGLLVCSVYARPETPRRG